jgi:hypothetical protein
MASSGIAAARRWFADSDGKTVHTRQVNAANGSVWEPGPRTVVHHGRQVTLNGSHVGLDQDGSHAKVDGDNLHLEWRGDSGRLIHTTTYSR